MQKSPYPMLGMPPVAQAEMRMEPDAQGVHTIRLNYGGVDVVCVALPAGIRADTRIHSDGTVQSQPLVQQVYLSAPAGTSALVTLTMRQGALCMRPGRACGKQAILGQMGNPLLFGVNGWYGLWEDLLLSWYGAPWHWNGDTAVTAEDGATAASFTVTFGNRPFYLLLRPRYYGQHLGYGYHAPWKRRPDTRAVSGWCSWEAYHRDVTMGNLRDAAALMAQLKPYGLTHIQLDDGFQQPLVPPARMAKVSDAWLNTNERFPGGHEAIVRHIRERGLVPGVWTNAMINNAEAATDGLCMMDHGEPVRGYCVEYVLNCTDEVLRAHVLPYYVGLRALGYTYFKTDAIRHLCLDGLQECVRRGLMTDAQANDGFRRFMACAREGIGEDAYLLSCWGMLTQSVGLADACRVATDATPAWEQIHMQVYETARCFFAQRVLFTLDPDHVCARTNVEWARMLLSFVSLTGGLYMLSDPLECYDEPRMAIIRKTLPALPVFTAETGPVDYTTPAFCWPENPALSPEEISAYIGGDAPDAFGTLWATHFRLGDRCWTVAQRVALFPLGEEAVPLDALGLDPARQYAAFDFWEEQPLGVISGAWHSARLPVGHTQVCALTPIGEESPVLIGSNRHVSMDAASVTGHRREKGMLTLTLHGVAGQTFRYYVYAAQACEAAADVPITLTQRGEVACIAVQFDRVDATVTVRMAARTA